MTTEGEPTTRFLRRGRFGACLVVGLALAAATVVCSGPVGAQTTVYPSIPSTVAPPPTEAPPSGGAAPPPNGAGPPLDQSVSRAAAPASVLGNQVTTIPTKVGGVAITAPAVRGVAFTGSNVDVTVRVGLTMALAGAGIMLLARRRRPNA